MLKRSQLEKWFPDDELLVVPVDALPSGLVDDVSRKLLTDVGLPESFLDVMELDARVVERVPTVDEMYRRQGEEPPAGTEDLFYLGFAGQLFLAVHGKSGAVVQVHQNVGVRPIASNLETFVRVLGFVSDEVRKYQGKRKLDPEQFAARLRDDTLKQLRRTDPAVLPEGEAAWRDLLGDIAATAA